MPNGREIVIFDLDGTLADVTHRLKLITKIPPDYSAFDAACIFDQPYKHTVEILKSLHQRSYEIWILSGRSDHFTLQTQGWLKKHDIPFSRLFLRPNKEKKPIMS